MGAYLDILLYNVVAFLGVLTVIVAVHEAGHFFVARWCRVRVLTFSIGFGPELFGWTGREGTRYKVSLLPLGGYVRMAGGLMPGTEEAAEQGAFPAAPVWRRALIILAGPFANFLFAFIVLFGMVLAFGSSTRPAEIAAFSDGSAAAETALLEGDIITAVNGRATETFNDVARIMALHTGGPVTVEATREGLSAPLTVTINPTETTIESASGPVRVFRLGIIATDTVETRTYGPVGAAGQALASQAQIASLVFQGMGQVITGRRPVSELEGPVGMSKHVAEATRSSVWQILQLMIFLNMIIGLMNLLPVPVLDGGHLVFLAFEAIFRRPLPARVMEVALLIGLGLILTQFVFVTFQDLVPNRTAIPGWLPRF